MSKGIATFPGVSQIHSVSVTATHGVAPAVFTVTIAPQFGWPAAIGTLALEFGSYLITFQGCRVDSASFQFNQSGALVSIQILDRRWKWQYGKISGAYNLRNEDGSIVDGTEPQAISDTELPPQDMATKLFEAMGETKFEVKDLPNDPRPTAEWDYANPAQELARLCEDLGCRVMLNLDGIAVIRKLGEGNLLPQGPFINESLAMDPPELPSEMICVSSPIRFQADIDLEAVGEDKDHKIKLIDDLSYKPASGWETVDIPGFNQLEDQTIRDLAKKSVFKMYRIKAPIEIPGYPDVLKITQVTLLSTQNDTKEDFGEKRQKPAVAFGIWFDEGDGNSPYANTAATLVPIAIAGDAKDKTVIETGMSIDAKNRLVRFNNYIYQWNAAGTEMSPAELKLRVAFHMRTDVPRTLIRHETPRELENEVETEPMIVSRNDLLPFVSVRYNALYNITGTDDNLPETNTGANYYLDAALRDLTISEPATVVYAGLFPIELDGAIQSVTYTINQSGAFTRATRNSDPGSETVVPYKFKRALEKQKVADKVERDNRGKQRARQAEQVDDP